MRRTVDDSFRAWLVSRPAWQRLLLGPFIVTAVFIWAYPILHVFAGAILIASVWLKVTGWLDVTSIQLLAWACGPYAVVLIAALAVSPVAALHVFVDQSRRVDRDPTHSES